MATHLTTAPVGRETAEAVQSAILRELSKVGVRFGWRSIGFDDGSVLVVSLEHAKGLYTVAVRSYACGG